MMSRTAGHKTPATTDGQRGIYDVEATLDSSKDRYSATKQGEKSPLRVVLIVNNVNVSGDEYRP
jgi:hypothetical protein